MKVSEKYLLSGVGNGGSASLPKSNKNHQMEYADNNVCMYECMYVCITVCMFYKGLLSNSSLSSFLQL